MRSVPRARHICLRLAVVLLLPGLAHAQIINAFAGGGAMLGDGGPATEAQLAAPQGVATDAAGNVFIADNTNFRIRRVDAGTSTITTIAGTGTFGYSGDGGAGTGALISAPIGIAVDAAGNVYFADTSNNRIRRISAATGVITTVAGNGLFGYTGDGGSALSARLGSPEGVAVAPDGDIYIADTSNFALRRVDAVTGIITSLSDVFLDPRRVAIDANENVYVLDVSSSSRVHRYSTATATWSIVAGGGPGTGESGPPNMANLGVARDVAVDNEGRLLIAGARRVWRVDLALNQISIIAGTGAQGDDGDGGPAMDATFVLLGGVGAGPDGSVYISDAGIGAWANRVRVISPPGPVDVIITADTPQSFLDSLVTVTGSLIISGDVNIASLSLPNLVQVGGDIIIAGNTALTTVGAPTLKQVDGSIEIDGNPMLGVVDFGALGNIGGSFTVANSDNPQFDFGALGNIGGSFTVADNNNPQFDFGALGNIGGSFTVANSDNPQFDFGALGNIGGSFTVADNNNPQFTLPALEDVGGDFNYGGNAMPTVLVLPSLTTLGGSFIVQGNGALVTLSAPLLDEVPGSVGIDGNPALGVVDFGALGAVGQDVTVTNYNNASVDFSALGAVGQDVTVTNYNNASVDFSALGAVGQDVTVTNYNDNPQAALGRSPTPITFPALTSVGGDLTVSTVGQAVHDFANAVVLGNTSITAIGTNLVLLQSAAGSTHVALDGLISGHAITLPQSTFASPTPLTVRWLEPAELEPAPGLDAGSEAVIIDPLAGTFYGFLEPTFIAPAQVTITLDVELLDENTRTQVLNALAANLLTIAVRGDDKGDLYIARALCTIPQPDACIAITLLDDKGQPMDPQSKEAPAYIEFAAIATQFSRWSVVIVTPDCRPDLNNDGNLDFFDIATFLSAFSISDPIADWNADTNFDFFDIVTFLGDFATGCP